jgi:hypothetical protein
MTNDNQTKITAEPTTETVSKKYILIRWHDYTKTNTIIMNNAAAMDYIVLHSENIEFLEYVDIVIPA